MLKKIPLFLVILTFCCNLNFSYADDFHRTYRNVYSNKIKTPTFEELNRIPLKLQVISDISTKRNLTEGQKVVFLTKENIVLTHKKVLPAGSRVFGTVETISQNEPFGVPANLIIGNFKIEYMPTIKLEGQIIKQGANRTYWAFNPLFFAVRGGHAKIKADEVYTVYYTPPAL